MRRARCCARLTLVAGIWIVALKSGTPRVALCGVRNVLAEPCGVVWRKHHRSRHLLDALPDGADLLPYFIAMQEDTTGHLQHAADAAAAAGSWLQRHAVMLPDLRLVPPAFADAAGVAELPPPLDPNVQFLYGADGAVLRDLQSGKPLVDDWWNFGVGLQASGVRIIDQALRFIGVPQAFGWTVLVWTFLVKLALLPLDYPSARSSALLSMLAPKIEEFKQRFKDDTEEQNKRIMKLYDIFDVNVFGSLIPLFVQLPIIFTLLYSWRRLGAEKFEYYSEPWFWIPSLSQPNPDFNLSLDWLLQFDASGPVVGWDIWMRQLIVPVALISYYLKNAFAAYNESKTPNLFLLFLPPTLIGVLVLEFPQLMGLYYTAYNLATAAQVEVVKRQIRSELPMFRIFEETGQFPEGNFEEVYFPDIHQASAKGNIGRVQELLDSGVDPLTLSEGGDPPIILAAAAGHLPIVILLLAPANKSEADHCLVRSIRGNTVLHVAAAFDRQPIVQFLVEYLRARDGNYDWLNLQNDEGFTVLDMAKAAPGQSVLRYLVAEVGLNLLPDPEEKLPQREPVSAAPVRARSLD